MFPKSNQIKSNQINKRGLEIFPRKDKDIKENIISYKPNERFYRYEKKADF